MNIKLNWFRIKNFKGIKDLIVELNGKNINIFGNNATGKTTTMDAIRWLFFDKDSNDNTKFTIKPQDEDGKDLLYLEPTVESELLVDGKPLKLKKSMVEKWVKRQGATEKVFDGHTNKYWFNEVPCKAGEYKDKIDSLINENIFKMITDPLFFNTKLKWEERRKILLEISGDATDEQVIASDESLSRLTEILNDRSIDDYKLVLADKLKGLKKERDDLPPRIDELTRSLPNEEPDYSAIEVELKGYKDQLATVEFLMTNATNKANKITEKYQELGKLKSQLEKVKEKIKSESGADRKKLLEKKSELENGKFILQSGIRELQLEVQEAKTRLESNSKTRQRLLEEWRNLSDKNLEILSEEFEVGERATNCPTCGQDIPEETIATEIGTLRVKFEQNKKIKLADNIALLEKNKESGLALKINTEKIKSDLELAEKELSDKEFQLENLTISINALDSEIVRPIEEPDYTKYQEYNELFDKIEQLQAELDKPVEDKSSELLQKKADIQLEIEARNRVLNVKDEVEKKKARIEELKAEEKRVSTLIAELEGHKFLLEKFTVANVFVN
ncbi:AAA family ATPase [Tissierella pigra]|uniref:Rad50/SbcC-type AAA domain-containing protein n=1 Tax=Tissierella pigra TaxID=2607614 RepID=A0A6N7Y1D1_9FIRM|nr:AAA family ATPase [Tissierella pigra]MSU01810.1 hypothetical protein [Tissierella pigra]